MLLIPNLLFAQKEIGAHYEFKHDNFVGDDSEVFETEMQGLGSLNMNLGWDISYTFGKSAIRPFINFGFGYASKIFRFQNDLVFNKIDDQLIITPDFEMHEYNENFFSYSKSKLYNYYFRFNPEFGINFSDKFMFSTGPVFDIRLYIYQKNKFKIGDKYYSEELRRNSHFDSDLLHIGWRVNIGSPAVGFYCTYMTTPMFGGSDAPDIYPIEIGIYTRLFKNKSGSKFDDIDIDEIIIEEELLEEISEEVVVEEVEEVIIESVERGNNSNADKGDVYLVVEEMPEFPGGEEERMKFLANNIKYPEKARENGIQGTVYVNFVIEPDGSISNIKIRRGISKELNEEVIRVIKLMPKWIPGKQRGIAVRVSYNMPVKFSL